MLNRRAGEIVELDVVPRVALGEIVEPDSIPLTPATSATSNSAAPRIAP